MNKLFIFKNNNHCFNNKIDKNNIEKLQTQDIDE